MAFAEEQIHAMENDPYYAPKVWDFAYPSGHAPPPSTPVLKAIDEPVFCPCPSDSDSDSDSDSRRSSASSSSPTLPLATKTNTNTNTTEPTPPQTPKLALRNLKLDEESMPAWARSLPVPKEVFTGCGSGDEGETGLLLFPENSKPNSRELPERRKGIKRAGHPMLKLSVEEMHRPFDSEL